jgi:hypothetical protein
MPTSLNRPLHPSDFAVNRTWLVFRVNQRPVFTGDGEFDIFVLQDAASMFLFGTAVAPNGAECPPEQAVVRLFEQAWSHSQEWPEELVLAGRPSPENAFANAARRQGIAVRAVAEARISFFIKDVQSSFEEFAGRADADDA